MVADDIKRRLAAIMSADVRDYSRLMREDEASTVRTLTAYKGVMKTLVEQHHGRVVDSTGDNLLAEFASVVDAVQGAVAVQKELKAKNAEAPDKRRMEFRIGINLGDVIVEEDRIFGDGVNIAARLEGLADPGGICISRTAYDQIEDKLPFGYEYLGERTVKNIPKPIRAYKVLLEPEEAARGVRQQGEAGPWERGRHFRHITMERRSRRRVRPTAGFSRHLRAYIGVIGFLLIIDLLTGGGLWFYWPALGWGFALFMHWSRGSTSEGESMGELNRKAPPGETPARGAGGKPKYLRVQIQPKDDADREKRHVNIRIPLRVLRAGAKLRSILPKHAREKISAALKHEAVDFDFLSLEGEKLEQVLDSLAESGIEIDGDDKMIRIFCE